ncbi:hypothetical protein KIN20_017205 [Parelaphostrongylus tenuis]|uniref:Uncharacterized protein n=1 Tax=Parelaphostrongylus tenuis TaxID=148309 RepID=A0AAD5N2B8_PARTN|nr:hypothetical protein KIN20_017205 [Parelaphostrongylus tenuis]
MAKSAHRIWKKLGWTTVSRPPRIGPVWLPLRSDATSAEQKTQTFSIVQNQEKGWFDHYMLTSCFIQLAN